MIFFSGKTLAFVVPMLNKILKTGAAKTGAAMKESKVLGIIISPTQELALQTDAVVKQFSAHISHIKTCVFVGGTVLVHDVKFISTEVGDILFTHIALLFIVAT